MAGFVAILIFAAVWWGLDWRLYDDGEVTTYPASCIDRKEAINSCALMTLNRATYKLDRDHNEVIYWHENPILRDNFRKLTRCIIRDRRNWSCQFQDGSGVVHVRDGLEPVNRPSDAYLRKWQWHLVDIFGPMRLGELIPDQLDRSLLE